jgi:hypothetical protein
MTAQLRSPDERLTLKYPFLPRVMRKLRRKTRVVLTPLMVRRLESRNARSTSAAVDKKSLAYVSLTTHGGRLDTVHLTIETIVGGNAKPGRLVLWLDDEAAWRDRPIALRRLEARGVEVRLTTNYGPHTKYYPALDELTPDQILVTADDDMLYPRSWLSELLRAHREEPDLVHCHRAHLVTFSGPDSLLPYDRWDECWTRHSSIANFATGVSGVVYPTRMVELLRAGGTTFLSTAPRADDVYLHAVAASHGIRVRQVRRSPEHYAMLPESQGQGLYHDNVKGTGNDSQIRATYGDRLLCELREARQAGD